MTRTLARAAVAALALSFIAGAGSAQPARVAGDAPRALVSYADLNLSSDSGRAQLAQRISAAAGAMCGSAPSILNIAATQAYRACLQATIASSAPTLDQAAMLQARSHPHLAEAANR